MKKRIAFILMLFVAFANVYAQDKQDPGIYFDKESLEYTIGQSEPFVEPKLVNPNNVPVYYISDNNSAASVDFNTGKVTFITEGVAKISAISNETDLYNPAQVYYTITIYDNSIIYDASFINDECGFTQQQGDPVVWEHEPDGYMKADAYGKVDAKTVFDLVSPAFKLSDTGNVVSFGECGSYFSNRWNEEAQLIIKESGSDSEWTVLDRNYPAGDQNTVKSTGDIKIPSKFNGKEVVIAFRYRSDGHSNSGVWHVRNLHVKAVASSKADANLAFDRESVEYVLDSGAPFDAPLLLNPNNLEVTYSSDNTSVANVEELTGKVTIVGEGTAVITAKSSETDKFEAGEASYTIRVKSAEDAKFADPALRSPMVVVEFTGQRCRYCPNTARGLQEKQIKYGKENYIITALHHLESFSKLPESMVSLYNAEAVSYAESMNIPEGLPHIYYNTLGTEISDLTLEELYQQDDLLECTGEVTYNSSNEFNVNVKTRLRSNQKEIIKGRQIDILLWTLENGIVAFQDDNGNQTYPEHNHIFRGSLNTTWGEPYEIGTEYNQVLKAPDTVMDINNTEIVVLFLDHNSRSILDAGCFKAVSNHTGITNVECDTNESAIYNLMGIRVNATVKGEIYIKNGRKFIAE